MEIKVLATSFAPKTLTRNERESRDKGGVLKCKEWVEGYYSFPPKKYIVCLRTKYKPFWKVWMFYSKPDIC